MRTNAVVLAVALLVSQPVLAQEWGLYVSTRDGFQINFPGTPNLTETTWRSQMDYVLPERIYSVDRNGEHYSLSVVDYSGLEQLGVERSKTCPSGNQQCRGTNVAAVGAGYWKQDERGAIVYATFKLLQRDAKVTSLSWEWQDMVEGHFLQLTNNADRSRTFAYIGMHEHKLYIAEGTVPEGSPEPGLFQQSMGWVDTDGRGIRYQNVYSNAFHGMGVYPKPAIVGGGRGAGAGAARDSPPAAK